MSRPATSTYTHAVGIAPSVRTTIGPATCLMVASCPSGICALPADMAEPPIAAPPMVPLLDASCAPASWFIGTSTDISCSGVSRSSCGERAASAGNHLHRLLRLLADALELAEIRAEHLDAHRRSDASGQHVDASLDGHGPGVGDARHANGRGHRSHEAIIGQAGTPLVLWLQRDRGVGHGDAR